MVANISGAESQSPISVPFLSRRQSDFTVFNYLDPPTHAHTHTKKPIRKPFTQKKKWVTRKKIFSTLLCNVHELCIRHRLLQWERLSPRLWQRNQRLCSNKSPWSEDQPFWPKCCRHSRRGYIQFVAFPCHRGCGDHVTLCIALHYHLIARERKKKRINFLCLFTDNIRLAVKRFKSPTGSFGDVRLSFQDDLAVQRETRQHPLFEHHQIFFL